MDSEPIDIFITCFLRQAYTEKTLSYLFERTKYPFRLFIIDNGGNDEVLNAIKDKIFLRVKLMPNAGIHAAHNVALALAESDILLLRIMTFFALIWSLTGYPKWSNLWMSDKITVLLASVLMFLLALRELIRVIQKK